VCNKAYPVELFHITERTDADGDPEFNEDEISYLISTAEAEGFQEIRFDFEAELNDGYWRSIGLSLNGEEVVTFAKNCNEPDCNTQQVNVSMLTFSLDAEGSPLNAENSNFSLIRSTDFPGSFAAALSLPIPIDKELSGEWESLLQVKYFDELEPSSEPVTLPAIGMKILYSLYSTIDIS